jgi:hypothetical protein
MSPVEARGMDGVLGVAAGFGGVAQLVSIGSAFWLGGRLLWRARRGGGAPERLLGVHLLLAIGVGSLLLTIATTSTHLGDPLAPGVWTALTLGGNLATIAGLMAALWFNYRVFHAGQPSGRFVAIAASGLMWIGFALYVHAGGIAPGTADLYGPASWPYVGAMVLGDLWLVSDALRFRSQLLRRLALGLAEPLVVDRLLLWSVASLARVGLVLIAPLISVLVGAGEFPVAIVTPVLCGSALLILTATVSLWLLLAPSEAYRRWVARRYARAA